MRVLQRLLPFALLMAVAGCAQPPPEPAESRRDKASAAEPGRCDEQRVELLLSAPHDPPSAGELGAACADPIPLLSRLARDTGGRGLLRLRAIESLGELGGPKAIAVLAELALASGELASVRRTAVQALVPATAPDDRERERVGVGALGDPDPHVRGAAARLLGGSASPDVKTALEQARARETEAFVKKEIERGLAGF